MADETGTLMAMAKEQPTAVVVERVDDSRFVAYWKTPKANAEADAGNALNVWLNVDAKKWLAPADECDWSHVEAVMSEDGSVAISGNGHPLFVVTKRMKAYGEVKERCGMPLQRVIAEPREGEYGDYYRVGLIFS